MNTKKQKDILTAWNEAEEIVHNFENMTLDELNECRECIKDRAKRIMAALDEYISESISQV